MGGQEVPFSSYALGMSPQVLSASLDSHVSLLS
jgi:hypothetical protein